MFLHGSWSIIMVRRPKPEIDGKSTSVRTRSILWGFSFKVSHAFKPSDTAATVEHTNRKCEEISTFKWSNYLETDSSYMGTNGIRLVYGEL